jgi:CheY-like chemotaxis protein
MEEKTAIKEVAQDVNIWVDKTILIAEDIELNYLYLRSLFKSTGAAIIRAQNGKEAVQWCIDDPKIDLVLMDLMMPLMNGYEATRQIKILRKDLPVIAQTAYVMSDDRLHAVVAGCDDFIAKPINKEELFKKMNHLLKLKQEIASRQ